MGESTQLLNRPWAAATFALGLLMLAVYVTIISSQGDVDLLQTLPWALLMTAGAGLALAATLARKTSTARKLLIGSALIYGLLGLVAILTIGLGFLITGALAIIAITRLDTEPR